MVKENSSFSRAINARSSAYLIKLRIPSLICISFIYKENNIGDKIHPCGAPELRIMASDNTRETLAFFSDKSTRCGLSLKNFLIHSIIYKS